MAGIGADALRYYTCRRFPMPSVPHLLIVAFTLPALGVPAAVRGAGVVSLGDAARPPSTAFVLTGHGEHGAGPEALAAAAAPASRPDGVNCLKPAIDPDEFFNLLVQRYRGIHLYRDTARVVHVTSREGAETSRIETEIGCEVRAGALKVQTPGTQARSGVGLGLPLRPSPASEAIQRGYDLWLAPHMALKFTDEPLKDFRSGVEEGFTATEAERITIDNRDMLHVELRSGDGLSEDCNAKFDLFINPQTMLVERIDGEQRMPDGASCTTSLHISPQEVEGGEPAAR
jgi:hypothetical protein